MAKMINKSYWKLPVLSLVLSLALTAFAQPANAQYMRELNKGEDSSNVPSGQYNPGQNESQSEQSPALTYNPYIPKSVQRSQGERDAQQQERSQSRTPLGSNQFDLGSALLEDFAKKSQLRGQDLTAWDPNAPRRENLVDLSALPNDPTGYCEDYESNNPQTQDLQAYMETFIHERIKPISQMNIMTPKSCLRKVNEIAEKMLVDYTDFKRNDLILRAGKNKGQAAAAARKANRLPKANATYLMYARSECTLSRQVAAKTALELSNLVEACVIQMMKRRIQQISDM
jgi:hypothetical protein